MRNLTDVTHTNTASKDSARKHESAPKHVAGEATYVDDIIEPRGTLYGAVGFSSLLKVRLQRWI